MIRYALACADGHEFEAWFRNSEDFDVQKHRGLVECPHCGSIEVAKQLMAPSVRTSRQKEATTNSAPRRASALSGSVSTWSVNRAAKAAIATVSSGVSATTTPVREASR